MLEILISSSVLILVLALLRHFLRGRIPARLQYALWLLVLLRLLIPITTVPSKASVANIAEPIGVQIREFSAAQVQTVYFPVDLGPHPQTGEPMESVARSYVEPLDVLRWVWYGGMAAMALWFAAENLRMARRLNKNRLYWGSYESFPVYTVPDIPSPCLFGLFKPAIYLTEQAAADDALSRRVLAHEYTHIRHLDILWSLLRSVCLVVWWFNPLVWWAAALSRRDAELACDEGAIRRLGEEQRFEYGRSLLSLATVKTRPRDLLCGATTMTGGKNSLRERIEGIARTKKLSVSLAVLCVAVAAAAVGCTFTGAQTDAAPTPAPTVTPGPIPTSDAASPESSSNLSSSLTIGGEVAETLQRVEGASEAYMLYSIYLDDFMDPDPGRWLTWLRFESDMEKQLSLDNYHPLRSAEILSVEKINDKLFAFTVQAENTTGMPAEKFFNFLVLDPEEGSYVIRNVSKIPDELSENLDPARYDPQLLMTDGMAALGAQTDAAPTPGPIPTSDAASPESSSNLSSSQSFGGELAEDALDSATQMASKSQDLISITIPAGCSMGQIFQTLEDNGVCSKEDLFETAANHDFDYDWLEYLPLGDASRLEGYLFPGTYDFCQGETAVNIINRFLSGFHSILTSNIYKQADKLGISLHEAVIIASLIEKEANTGDDRSLFSSVIHNRLNDGQKLQLASTLSYIKGVSTSDLTADDVMINSPYNTYLYEGLPVGPICSPSQAALNAALNPSSINYWYWYTHEGTTHFFSNSSDFGDFVATHTD